MTTHHNNSGTITEPDGEISFHYAFVKNCRLDDQRKNIADSRRRILKSTECILNSAKCLVRTDDLISPFRKSFSSAPQNPVNYFFEDCTEIFKAPEPAVSKPGNRKGDAQTGSLAVNGEGNFHEIDVTDITEMRFWCREFNVSGREIISAMQQLNSKRWRDVKNFLVKKKQNGNVFARHAAIAHGQSVNGDIKGSPLHSI